MQIFANPSSLRDDLLEHIKIGSRCKSRELGDFQLGSELEVNLRRSLLGRPWCSTSDEQLALQKLKPDTIPRDRLANRPLKYRTLIAREAVVNDLNEGGFAGP